MKRAFIFCLKTFKKVMVGEMAWGAVRGCIKEPTSMGRHSPRVTTESNLLVLEMPGPNIKGEHVALHRQIKGILHQPHNYSTDW